MSKIRLVVVNENILGYITSSKSDTLYFLRASILRGANTGVNQHDCPLGKNDIIRTASIKDFEAFNCVADGFIKDMNYIMIR